MSDDYKKRIRAIIEKQQRKQLEDITKIKRKNGKPEKLVEAECLVWMRTQGWDVAIYESKATWNKSAQRYTNTALKAGTSDCMGTTGEGVAVYIEFKAKGKLSTFSNEKNLRQQDFLISKINHGAFACVVDSVQLLSAYYIQWAQRRMTDVASAKIFLVEQLPRSKKEKPLSF